MKFLDNYYCSSLSKRSQYTCSKKTYLLFNNKPLIYTHTHKHTYTHTHTHTHIHTHTYTHHTYTIQLHIPCCNPVHKTSPKPSINSPIFNEKYSYWYDHSYSRTGLYRHEGNRIFWFQIATITFQYHKEYNIARIDLDYWLFFVSWVQGVT